MHFLLFLLILSQSKLFLKEESTTPFTKANGNYADDNYVELNKVKSETFTYSSNGDKENHPISNAFSSVSSDSQGWVAKNPNTNTFHNSIIINFDKQAKIEAILHDASYSIKNDVIEYNGFPLILKIYSSTSDDEPFRLQATFSGECPEQDNTWTRTQFILPNPVYCTRLQIEFTKVTADNSFSDGSECPAVNKIHFIGKLQYYESTFEKVKNNYGVANYVNSHKISTDQFSFETTGDKSKFPKSNLFDGKDNTYWASLNPNTDTFKASISINFTETTTIEGIIYSPSYYSGTPRQFHGFPYKLTVYTALKDRPLTIHTVFQGDLPTANDWAKTQYVFTPVVVCDRMMIEFTEVSADKHTSNGAISAVAAGLELIKPEFGSLPLYAAAGVLADRNYINSHKIDPSDFDYTSNGDKSGRPLSGAFDNIYGAGTHTYWVSEIVTDSFKPILSIDFHRMATVECILNFHAYSTDSATNTRRFDGFPLKLKIYRSLNDDDSYELVNTFEGGTPNDPGWTNTQYAFNAPIRCKKMKIEFIDVTPEKSFSGGEIRVASNQFIIIGAIDPPPPTPLPTQTPIPTRSPMPNTNQSYIDQKFSVSIGVDQIQTSVQHVFQISGCTFNNIDIPGKNYYIRADTELLFFDNIFEDTANPTKDVPGILWDNYNGKITISNCKFIRIASKGSDGSVINTNTDADSSQLELVIEKSEFIDCGRANRDYPLCNTADTDGVIKFIECNFTFSKPDFSFRVLECKSNNNAVFEGCHFTNCASNSIRLAMQTNDENPIGTFIFRNNYVKSNQGCLISAGKLRSKPTIENNIIESTTLSNSYLISITHDQREIELHNNTFTHITNNNGNTNSYGGGTCISLSSSNSEYTIKFTLCKFYDIINNEKTTSNCHGGSFQYGFSNEINAHIEFDECEFKNNEAKSGHGGSIAIRTSKSVSIRGCIFESNTANSGTSSSHLLFNNHYDEKGKGYGGAIYINPSFHLNDQDYYMSSVTISGCVFKSNKAYQGYGIYIEGEDCETIFQISNNQFNNNQGINNHIDNAGIIASEVLIINKEEIEELNQFSNSDDAENFIYVFHSGERIPDPTPSRTVHPDTVHTYINKNFTEIEPEQIQTNEHNVRQISGCIFKDINIPTRNYYIKAETELLFYDNIFENTANPTTDTAGILWDNYNGKITISNCKFIRIASKGSDGSVINTNTDADSSQLELIIEKSEFIDCGRANRNYPLCNTADTEGVIKFIECNFTFSKPDFSFRVLECKSNNNAVFEGCHFTNCASNSIRLAMQTNDENPIGTFIFRNNYVKSNQGCLISAGKLRSKPTIENNIIESTTLSNSYLISITHDQREIELHNNTFTHITNNNGNTNSYGGGTCISLSSSNSEYTIKFTLCKFYDIINNEKTTSNCHGGSFQYGFSNEINAHIEFDECEFKNNEAKSGHGGSIAIRTSKSVSIRGCIFESNTANNENDLSGAKGFGGAIYISTTITSNDQEINTQSVSITGCTFTNNHAYQGYAIYLQGSKESSTLITINENNKFITNEGTVAHPKKGGIIATEALSFSIEGVENNNDFTGETSTTIKHVLQVDSIGNPLPKDVIVITPSEIPEKRVDRPNKDTETTESTPIVQVKVTDFIDIKHPGDFGGAIYVTNYGLECNQIKFDNCSSEAAGGGIYIKNDKLNLDNNIFLSKLKFNQCKAVYGGAVYVYSESESSNVTIKICEFTNNEASQDESLEMFGGSSIFLTALRSVILRCKFSKNIGASVKLYNLNNEAKNLLSSVHNSILITDCEFNKESIYFIRARKDIAYEINNCSFTGKLNEKSRYINGKTVDENGQKLLVKNCKFDVNQFKVINMKDNNQLVNNKIVLNDYYNYLSIDLNDQQFATDDKKDDEKLNINKLFLAVIFTVGIVVGGLIVVVVIKLINHENDNEQLNINDL